MLCYSLPSTCHGSMRDFTIMKIVHCCNISKKSYEEIWNNPNLIQTDLNFALVETNKIYIIQRVQRLYFMIILKFCCVHLFDSQIMHNTTVNHNYYLTNFSDSAISSKSQSSTHQFRCFEVQYEYVDLNTTHSCSNLLPLGTTTQLCDSAQIELANRTLFVKRRGAKSFTSDSCGWT